ncbi:MAG: Mur ligase domain-containing protein [Methylococcaceae bacterium]
MRMHIIGVATTFMKGLAVLASHQGHEVTGSDSCIDLSTRMELEAAGVQLQESFKIKNFEYLPELVVIGNDLHLDNPELLEVHRHALPCISGEEWLSEYVLHDKWTKNTLQDSVEESPKKSVKHLRKPPLDVLHSKLNQRIFR